MTAPPASIKDQGLGRLIWEAANENSPEQLATLLSRADITAADINYVSGTQRDSPLTAALMRNFVECARILMRHPLVDVNFRNGLGVRALWLCLRLPVSPWSIYLLQEICGHAAIEFNFSAVGDATPLWNAAGEWKFQHVRRFLALCPDGVLDLCRKGDTVAPALPQWPFSDPKRNRETVHFLLTRYRTNPKATRARLRIELCYNTEEIAQDFATGVLLSDGFFKETFGTAMDGTRRFWRSRRASAWNWASAKKFRCKAIATGCASCC